MLILPGAPALSAFSRSKLANLLSARFPQLRIQQARFVHFADLRQALDARGRLTGPQGAADDLKKIKGVGPAFEKKLQEAGIFHFWQIAALSDDQVSSLEEELAFQGRMERDDWKGQAEELMSAG
jgi:predicted flap endonuclease-1-like 5' DNA nuclease